MAGILGPLTPEEIAASYYSGKPLGPSTPPAAATAEQQLGIGAFGAPPPPPRPAGPEGLSTRPTADDPFGLKAAASAPGPGRITALPPEKLSGPDLHQSGGGSDPFGLGGGKPMTVVLPGLDPKALPKEQAAPLGPSPAERAKLDAELAAAHPPGPAKGTQGTAGGAGPAPAGGDPYGIKNAENYQRMAQGQQYAAAQARGEAEASQANARADVATDHQRKADDNLVDAQKFQALVDEKVQKDVAYYRKRADAIRAKQIDPTGGVSPVAMGITAALSMGLQGLVSIGTKGRTNIGMPFLDLLNKQIERGIAAQETELGAQKTALDADLNALGQNVRHYGNMESARRQLHLDHLTHAYKLADEQAKLRGDSEIAKTRSAGILADIEGEIAAREKELGINQLKLHQAAAGAQVQNDAKQREQYLKLSAEGLAHAATLGISDPNQAAQFAENWARRQLAVGYGHDPALATPRGAPDLTPGAAGAGPSLLPAGLSKDMRNEALKEIQARAARDKVNAGVAKGFKDYEAASITKPGQLASVRSAIAGTIMANVPGIRSDVDFKEIVEPNLPEITDTAETRRKKEQTIRQFVDSKTSTPILDYYGKGEAPKVEHYDNTGKPIK